MSKKLYEGLAIRYLPGVCSFNYQEKLKQDPQLTPQQYAQNIHDYGLLQAVRVYSVNSMPIIFVRDTPYNQKKYQITDKLRASDDIYQLLYNNNLLYTKFSKAAPNPINDPKDYESLILGIPKEVFLSQIWAILELTQLDFIEPTDLEGNVNTNIGTLRIVSA